MVNLGIVSKEGSKYIGVVVKKAGREGAVCKWQGVMHLIWKGQSK